MAAAAADDDDDDDGEEDEDESCDESWLSCSRCQTQTVGRRRHLVSFLTRLPGSTPDRHLPVSQ